MITDLREGSGKEEGKDEKKKNEKYHGCFFNYFFVSADYLTINEQIQNIAQKKDTLCRRMYN